MCFACVGSGGEWTTAKVVERRAKARDRYAAKTAREQEARRAARLAAVEAERAEAEKTFQAWADEHADLVDGVSKIKGQSTLVKELRDRLEAHLPLTENQAAATLRLIAEMATATPVPEGRVTVTGTVVGRKLIETFYTYTGEVHVKITVRDDRGFKVYGTASKDIRDVERGDRVTFTAALEPSRDDDTFGFFKRPTKASILERAPKGEEEDLDLEPDVGSQAVGEVEAAVRAAPPAPAGPKVEAMAPRPPRDASMAYAASHQHDTGPGAVGLGVDRW
ncbi:MAG: hypothetical protein LBK54_06610 [Propionibacteriaceae bacterium]|jgi:hypothetical protein|nr:hypothetical protein [Propionibacteriaceae bacterium]